MTKTPSDRVYYLDWLRVIAILFVFLFHSSKYFSLSGYHVSNNETAFVFSFFCDFIQQWGMPLFFLISGMSVSHATVRKGKKKFWQSKINRLLIPLLGGIFIFAPFQVFFERKQGGDFLGSFIDFFPHYFDGWYGFGGNFAWMGLHLWYVLALLIFLIISPPFLGLLNRIPFEKVSNRTWFPLVFLLPLIAFELFINQWPKSWGVKTLGGWSIFTYFYFFLIGTVIAKHDPLGKTFQRIWAYAIGIALTIFIAENCIKTLDMINRETLLGYSYRYSLLATHSWLWQVGVIGLVARHLNIHHPVADIGNQYVLPFYIWHQPVIITLGYYVSDVPLGLAIKAPLFVITALILTCLACYLTAQLNLTRMLVGMKPQK